jgi:hypothetical protein
MQSNQTLCFTEIHRGLTRLFDGDLHAKRILSQRILSLANATLGVVRTASLAVNTIGQGLALARGLVTKHAIKQVDRLLSNEGIDIDAALRHWVPYVVGPRNSINVAMDWTDFDADGQATIMLSLLTRHGRATPLLAHGRYRHSQEPSQRVRIPGAGPPCRRPAGGHQGVHRGRSRLR